MNRKFEIFLEVQYHLLIGVGMVMIIIAVVSLQEHKSIDTMKALLRAGSAVVGFCWLLLTCWALWASMAFEASSSYRHYPAQRGGKCVSFTYCSYQFTITNLLILS